MAALELIYTLLKESGITLPLRQMQLTGRDVLLANWHLGLTAFGGPPVHFQILRRKFVDELEWIDEQTYQELFAISNSLPGPASTKMLVNINVIRGSFVGGLLAFLIWSLPGAIIMFCFSLGVTRIGDSLPEPVYALLSGLNAATVGIIALAAVQLSRKVITDKLTRILVFLGGAAGMLYTALWYFPVLMIAAGTATVVWDLRLLSRLVRSLRPRRADAESTPSIDLVDRSSRSSAPSSRTGPDGATTTSSQAEAGLTARPTPVHLTRQSSNTRDSTPTPHPATSPPPAPSQSSLGTPLPPTHQRTHHPLSWRAGALTLAIFFFAFLTILLLRALLHNPQPTRTFSLFANLSLAGTIIFGGGPVVIPLLRDYVVAENWVSPRDFLLGLALIQAMPGPNFNFAVYLGALAVAGTPSPGVLGACVAFVGIFAPGLVIQAGFMGFWSLVRKNRAFLSALRGVNAAAVGLIFTAVYRVWQIGFLDRENQEGMPLGGSPWWVVVTATSYVGGEWFALKPPVAVVVGAVMGLVWYGVVQAGRG